MLCRVTAAVSRMDLFSAAPSGPGSAALDRIISQTTMKHPPSIKPAAGISHEPSSSMAGAKSDQKDAAVITPAANPIIRSSSLWFISRIKKTSAAPQAVTKYVKHVAKKPCQTGLSSKNHAIEQLLRLKGGKIHTFYGMELAHDSGAKPKIKQK
jgi:hypothetical protein